MTGAAPPAPLPCVSVVRRVVDHVLVALAGRKWLGADLSVVVEVDVRIERVPDVDLGEAVGAAARRLRSLSDTSCGRERHDARCTDRGEEPQVPRSSHLNYLPPPAAEKQLSPGPLQYRTGVREMSRRILAAGVLYVTRSKVRALTMR